MSFPATPTSSKFIPYTLNASSAKKRKLKNAPDKSITKLLAMLPECALSPVKMQYIIAMLKHFNWPLGKLLDAFFSLDIDRSPSHEGMVQSLLTGSENIKFIQVLELIYKNAILLPYRDDDRSHPKDAYDPSIYMMSIEHAHPAMNARAMYTAGEFVAAEGKKMAHVDSGLHLPASSKATRVATAAPQQNEPHGEAVNAEPVGEAVRTRRTSARQTLEARKAAFVTWEKLSQFSIDKMQDKFKTDAPITWHMLKKYTETARKASTGASAIVMKRGAYRPLDTVRGIYITIWSIC